MNQEDFQSGGERFPLTRRSVIEAVHSIDAEERERALEALCAAYWKPVYKYVRLRWNRPADVAQDLTQGFFVELLERELLEKFDSKKSRLRTYLRLCVDSFVMNDDKSGRRQKRGGTVPHVALDFAGAEEELGATVMDPAAIPSPESLEEFFEKEWVRSLFALAVEDLRELCVARERERTFRLFESYELDGNKQITYEQLSKEFGIPVTDVTNALAWARREFRKIALERLRDGAEAPDLAGTRYRLLERIARGGMGVVYAAEDENLQRRVALKVLDVPGSDGDLANRLIREARVLAALEHPGIVPVHDVGTLADGRVFYTMKFVEGKRLDKFIESVASVPDRLRLFLRVCDAVAFAHARGVLHRDLKPANIMVGPFGEVLVMDWGLAKILRGEDSGGVREADPNATVFDKRKPVATAGDATEISVVTGHGTVMGTPGYMSPEQARGDIELLDSRSDIYSLGALLRFWLTGQPEATSLSNGSRIDKSLAAICAKSTAASPAERYPKVQGMALDVSRYLDGLAVGAHRESLFEKARRFYRRYRFFILLIAAYLAMRVLILLFMHR